MRQRILVVEADPAVRSMIAAVLGAEAQPALTVASIRDAELALGRGEISLAIVDEAAGAGGVLEEVKLLRELYPTLPLIVTGTLLSQPLLLVLLRLGAQDALPKPFTPAELRESVRRVIERSRPEQAAGCEYAAALRMAREAIATARLASGRAALGRVAAVSMLDADVLALAALCAELAGHDEEATGGYAASLALRHEEDAPAPHPHAGLARLAAYGDARPVASLSAAFRGAPVWLVESEARELACGPPEGLAGRVVVVLGLGIEAAQGDAVYFREGTGDLAFVLLPGPLSARAISALCARYALGRAAALESTARVFDVDSLNASLAGSATPQAAQAPGVAT
jgi:DNA-binding response OmpR family regulator